jgi:hypothetical protein
MKIPRALVRAWKRHQTTAEPDLQTLFTRVYQDNIWGDSETRSGPGSRKDSGSVVASIEALTMAYDQFNVRTMSDIPCGDFNWIERFLDSRPELQYAGYDIVEQIIRKNRDRIRNRSFSVLNIVDETPPRTDLIFCKDLLNHLKYADVRNAISRMKASGSVFLLATNNFGYGNEDLPAGLHGGESRLLDIVAAPLNFAPPIWNTHYLGLWRLADL